MQGSSALPYNITTGFDANGDTVFNDRPAGVDAQQRPRRVAVDVGPAAEQVDRPRRRCAPGAPGMPGMPPPPPPSRRRRGGAARSRRPGGGGGDGPQMVVMEGGATRRYRLDLYVNIQNAFNNVNYNAFIGNQLSSFFGTADVGGRAAAHRDRRLVRILTGAPTRTRGSSEDCRVAPSVDSPYFRSPREVHLFCSSDSVIVVGAGIVGCTVAYELAKSGARVQVIETRAPGQGATRASAGILAPYIEGHELDAAADRSAAAASTCTTPSSRAFAPTAATTSSISATAPSSWRSPMPMSIASASLSAAFGSEGIEARWVPPAGFDDYEPLASTAARGALLIPTHGFVGVTSLTLAAAAAAEKLGARFTAETGAIRILRHARRAASASQASSQRGTPTASCWPPGSWSSQITVEGADPVPVKPIRGQLIQLQADAGRDASRDLGPRRLPRAVAGWIGAGRIDR